jgi:hypothetical protein
VKPPLHAEYVYPHPRGDLDTQWARMMLIEAAQEICPDFLRTLSKRVFPLYARLAKDEHGEIKSTDDWNRLDNAISKWAARHGDCAHCTLGEVGEVQKPHSGIQLSDYPVFS